MTPCDVEDFGNCILEDMGRSVVPGLTFFKLPIWLRNFGFKGQLLVKRNVVDFADSIPLL